MLNKSASLTPEVLAIVKNKRTEYPFTGEYTDHDQAGTYLCRQCGLALFRAEQQFHSGCGWPSFDQDIPSHVKRETDADGKRTEILCARCNAHLGHVFEGEGFTHLNTRHCVNSTSLDFVADTNVMDTEEAILAAGCFWGVEHYLKHLPGVLKTEVGYIGGHQDHPSYEDVCSKQSGHLETVRVVYVPNQVSYTDVVKYFFEIHDPTQADGQGPDKGQQYLSAIFYYDQTQKDIATHLIKLLKAQGLDIATRLLSMAPFWRAEAYHQAYYHKNGKTPYCHTYTKRF